MMSLSIVYYIVMYIFMVYVFLILLLNVHLRNKDKKIDQTIQQTLEPKAEKLHYYFIVPCVNEELVIGDTILSLLNIDNDSIIVPIDDASTDNTYDIMKSLENERIIICKREKPNAQLGKGEALNQALGLCVNHAKEQGYLQEDVIIGVVDADGQLTSNTIEELDKVFLYTDSDAVQMRVKMFSPFKNMLQLSQDIEFFTINNMVQKARRATNTVGLSGNGQFFRLKTILDSLGGSPWGTSLLDDYELTLKLMMNNVKISYVYDAYVYQQALTSYKRYIHQRGRWVQGNLDCLKYLKKIVNSKNLNPIQKLSIYYFLSQPFINIIADLCIIIFTFKFSWRLMSLDLSISIKIMVVMSFLLLLSTIFGIIFTITYVKDLKHHHEQGISLSRMVLLPLVVSYTYVVLFFSVVIAFWRQISNQHGWVKTKRD